MVKLKLSGEQIEQLQSAILGAFEADELRQFLLTHLDKYLSHISLSPNLKIVVLDVIAQAEREGWTDQLLRAVADERPNRPDIQALVTELLAVLESAPSPAPQSAPSPVAASTEPVAQPPPGEVDQHVGDTADAGATIQKGNTVIIQGSGHHIGGDIVGGNKILSRAENQVIIT
jgi:hypothetical protein